MLGTFRYYFEASETSLRKKKKEKKERIEGTLVSRGKTCSLHSSSQRVAKPEANAPVLSVARRSHAFGKPLNKSCDEKISKHCSQCRK